MDISVEEEPKQAKEVEEDELFGNIFLCESYVRKEYQFNEFTISLLCSNMATTDHDLTGQIIWPASKLLSWFIARNQDIFRDKHVVELGAGCGLAGFLAAKLSSKVAITDGNEVVMRLVRRNIELLNDKCNIFGEQFIWGVKTNVKRLIDEVQFIPDIIIGADVILWPSFVVPLLLTLRWLLSLKPSSKCYISYVNRAISTQKLFYEHAERLSLKVQQVDLSNLKLEEADSNSNSTLAVTENMFIFEISLVDFTQTFDDIPSEDIGWDALSESQNAPF